MSMLALNCGKTFSAEAQTFNAMAVTVILPPASSRFGREAGAQLFEFRDVGLVLLGDVRNRGPGFPQVLRRLAPHPAHGDALDFSKLGEVGQLRLRELSSLRRSGRCAEVSSDLACAFTSSSLMRPPGPLPLTS